MRKSYELEIAFLIIMALTGFYIAYSRLAVPSGSHPIGHTLGIIGTLLMLITETAYSLRKRTRLLNWAGPVHRWLSFHIVTGLVGPFLVLMHTAGEFRGLAGFTFFLTVLVTASGFIGRYLYARQHDGYARRLFQIWHTIHIPIGVTLFVSIAIHVFATIYFRVGLFQ
ncbi:MAG TPA: hypothetical protein VLL52_23200 [Anaerolineae bacterium]|nr:hypothetical protein [Anaerolineae bacterium]